MTNGGRSGFLFCRAVVRPRLRGFLLRCFCCWRSSSAGEGVQFITSSQLKTSAMGTPVRGPPGTDGRRGGRTATVTIWTGAGSEMDTWRGLRRPMDSRWLSVLLLEDLRCNIVGCGGVTGITLENRIWRFVDDEGSKVVCQRYRRIGEDEEGRWHEKGQRRSADNKYGKRV